MADSEAKWYILHTFAGYENKVMADIKKLVENRNFQDMIEDVMVPTVTKTIEKDNGEVKEVEEKLYPSYVFVKMVKTDETWQICRNTRGVTGFVGPETKPTPMSEEEVRELEKTEENRRFRSRSVTKSYSSKAFLRISRAKLLKSTRRIAVLS